MHKYKLKVIDIVCPDCVKPVSNLLLSCKNQITNGEMKVFVDVTSQIATVWVSEPLLPDDEVQKILRAAVEEMYRCHEVENRLLKGIVGIVSGAALMGLCFSGLVIPFALQTALAFLCTGLTIYLGKEVFIKAWLNLKSLFQGKKAGISMDLLLAASSVIAVAASFASLFVPWLPAMFDAALMILGFFHLGGSYKEAEIYQGDQDLDFCSGQDELVEALNPSAHKKISDLIPGDTIRIYSGQTIPVDGLCLTAPAAVCKINDTGMKNSVCPVKLQAKLEAGWQVPQGQAFIDIQVEKNAKESTLAVKNKQYEFSRLQKFQKRKLPPFEKLAEIMMEYFVPTILGLALVSAIAIALLFSPSSALECLISMMGSACPCTLGLIIPLAIKTAVVQTAADGMRIKSPSGFQFLSEIDTVIFDWNGTLTTGEPRVVYENLKDQDLGFLAALEGQSNHSIAASICEYSKTQRNLNNEYKVSEVQAHHSGLKANIGEHVYIAGNKEFLKPLKTDLSAYESKQEIENQKSQLQASHVTYFGRAKPGQKEEPLEYEIVGHVLLRDPLREDAQQVIRKLQALGIKVGIWSGSDEASLAAFAKQLKVDYYQANCLGSPPSDSRLNGKENKKDLMAQLCQQGRKTIMVGDSANDVFAMLESDFAIAIQSKNSHDLTLVSADAVLDPNRNPSKPLQPIVDLITTAKKTLSSIKTNMAINLIYSCGLSALSSVLIFGLGITIHPALSAGLMVAGSALLIWNLKRMVQKKPEYSNDALILAPQLNIYQALEPSQIQNKLELTQDKGKLPTPIPSILPQQTLTQDNQPQFGAKPW